MTFHQHYNEMTLKEMIIGGPAVHIIHFPIF